MTGEVALIREQGQTFAVLAVKPHVVMAALEDALILLDTERVIYETLPNSSRRLVNQAISRLSLYNT
jgi:hypothetical protein